MIPVFDVIFLVAVLLVLSHLLTAALIYYLCRGNLVAAQLAAIQSQVNAERAERAALIAQDAADSAQGCLADAGELVEEATDAVREVTESSGDEEDDGDGWKDR